MHTLTLLTKQKKPPRRGDLPWAAWLPGGLHSGKGRTEAEAVGHLVLSMAEVGDLLASLPAVDDSVICVRKAGAA